MSKAKTPLAFGIDIGGSGIKGAPVDLTTGKLAADRVRIPTPQPSTPDAVADTVRDLIDSFDIPKGTPVGVTFPAVIQHGVAKTAANVDPSWIGTDVDALLTERTGHEVFVVNDADAAGIAEMEFGAGVDQKGVVLVITLGTGVGSGMFVDGKLVPNSELGHIPFKGDSAEKYMAESVRDREELSWKKWSKRLQKYFSLVEFLFSPDLIIVGGGVSKEHEKFLPRLELNAPIVPAGLRNEAGIIGAAALAHLAADPAATATVTAPATKTSATKATATTPSEKSTTSKAPAKKASTTKASATKAPTTKAPAKKTTAGKATAGKASSSTTAKATAPAKKASATTKSTTSAAEKPAAKKPAARKSTSSTPALAKKATSTTKSPATKTAARKTSAAKKPAN
jgi:polyphosphate glucokinase